VLAALARIEFGLGAHLRTAERAVPLVVIEPFDLLVCLAKALGVVGPDGFGGSVANLAGGGIPGIWTPVG
jgi:hypothetical protein